MMVDKSNSKYIRGLDYVFHPATEGMELHTIAQIFCPNDWTFGVAQSDDCEFPCKHC